MISRILRGIRAQSPDMVFLGLLILCLFLALGGILAGLERRESLLAVGGGRKVDVVKVRKQMTDGTLSTRKAIFYKKLAE